MAKASKSSAFLVSSFLVTLWWSAAVVSGYSQGPPFTACDSMIPSHQQNVPQPVVAAPYFITMDKMSYSAGDIVSVTVQGADMSRNFKGVMLQARNATGQRVGTFALGTGETMLKTLACAGDVDTAVTHNSATAKNLITVSWMAPNMNMGNITFRATVVQIFDTFYVGILAQEIYFMQMPTGGTGTGTGGMMTPMPMPAFTTDAPTPMPETTHHGNSGISTASPSLPLALGFSRSSQASRRAQRYRFTKPVNK